MFDKLSQKFLEVAHQQVKINRLVHEGNENNIPPLSQKEWAIIISIHTGHLMEAVSRQDKSKIERELLHIAAPLLEMYCQIHFTN